MSQTSVGLAPTAAQFLALDDRRLLDQCRVETRRVRGPGGQHRNKTESAVRLLHLPTGVVVTAEERRSQHQNRANALQRLRAAIALHVRGPLSDSPCPSDQFNKCLTAEGRLRVKPKDERFWPIVAEVLDAVAAADTRVSDAAARLGLSTANLVAFLESDDKLWKRVNELRSAAGQKPLR